MKKAWLNNMSGQITALFFHPFLLPVHFPSPIPFLPSSLSSFFLFHPLWLSPVFLASHLSSNDDCFLTLFFFFCCIANFFRLSGIEQPPFYYAHYSVGQKFRKGIIGMICLISTMSGAWAGKIQMTRNYNNLEISKLPCPGSDFVWSKFATPRTEHTGLSMWLGLPHGLETSG